MSQISNKLNLLTQNMYELNEISNKLLNEMNRKNKVMESTLFACQKCSQFGGSKKEDYIRKKRKH